MTRRASFLCLLLALCLSACASGQQLGVREEVWMGARVGKIAVVEPLIISPFGLDEAPLQRLRDATANAAIAELVRHNVEVITPVALSHQLTELGVWQEFHDAVATGRALSELFEQAQGQPAPVEISTLRALAARGALPAPLLFIEIAYHTDGTCRVAPPEEGWVVRVPDGASLPAQCVTTHLYGKLVEPTSARPLWYNHALRELYGERSEDPMSNIAQTVSLLLLGPTGLVRLIQG
jgi:hypothetical protein